MLLPASRCTSQQCYQAVIARWTPPLHSTCVHAPPCPCRYLCRHRQHVHSEARDSLKLLLKDPGLLVELMIDAM